eukprot:TRINITY_DN762_c0_g1_i6.p1 TRINITY_DN762_c0_g1~~TRINITY_DN762_c0_g1_i6.p1  ORF type:complete len:1363 (+),score=276.28 TRINITY_DN762_c0_g1_i6:131-4219(+)
MQMASAIEVFLDSAARWPSRTAIECGSWRCTYAELSVASARLAALLRKTCIRNEDIGKAVVALRCHRGPFAYAAVLGIMRAGAAYVYLDPDFPDDRAEFILHDCAARASVVQDVAGGPGSLLLADGQAHPVEDLWRPEDERAESWQDLEIGASDLAYLIYTSGSTGKPKGVLLEHGSLCTFIAAERKLYSVTQEDRVLQGFSLAFDASVEELWVAWAAGAALVVGTPDLMRLGPDLASELTKMKITVLSTVPTLLKTMDDPTQLHVRVLILGGEALTQPLVDKWAPGRQMFNTYGPTEATVICTAAQVQPGRALTIGTALHDYKVFVLDDELKEVPPVEGAEGQLAVGGRAVARGYLNRPEANEKSFIEHPSFGRIYLTGDVVRWTEQTERLPSGMSTSRWEYGYVGRIDSQVKIRGFRIELGEIERSSLDCVGLTDVAVVAVSSSNGDKTLHAFATGITSGSVLVEHLRSKLPPAWIPSAHVLDTLPRLQASGKVDRNALANMVTKRLQKTLSLSSLVPDMDLTTEEGFAAAALKAAQGLGIHLETVDDDFFSGGGTSLTAASLVSQLRQLGRRQKVQRLEYISVRQVYECRTMARLAAAVESFEHPAADSVSEVGKGDAVGVERYYAVAFLQFLWIATEFIVASMVITKLLIALGKQQTPTSSTVAMLPTPVVYALAGLMFCMLVPTIVLLQSLWVRFVKTVIGFRPEEGKIRIWSLQYFRWWLVHHLQDMIPTFLLAGTPFAVWWARFMGAKIGKGVVLWQVPKNADLELLTVGDGVSVGQETFFNTSEAESGVLVLGSIEVRPGASIGCRVNLSPGAEIDEGAVVDDLSHVASRPAADVEQVSSSSSEGGDSAFTEKVEEFGILTSLAMLPLMTLLLSMYALVLPMCVYSMFSASLGLDALVGILPATGRFFTTELLQAAFWNVAGVLICVLLKWMIVGRLGEGSFKISSVKYLRFWFMQGLMQYLSTWLPISVMSVYYPWILWLLGARVGKHAEFGMQTFGMSPDLLTLGSESFLGDHTCVGAIETRRGMCELLATSIACKSFIANNSVVPAGCSIEEGVVIGAQSRAPRVAKAGSCWLGAPAMELASSNREEFEAKPSLAYSIWRYIWDALRAIALNLILGLCIFSYTLVPLLLAEHEQQPGMQHRISAYAEQQHLDRFWTWFAIMGKHEVSDSHDALFWLGCGVWGLLSMLGFLLTGVLLKWLLVCRFTPGSHKLHSFFMDRSNFYFAIRGLFSLVCNPLKGTPFVCMWFRLQGASIGSRVFMNSSMLSEPDLISVGNGACLNRESILCSHIFEGAEMKLAQLSLDGSTTLGSDALIFCGASMREHARLGPASACFKDEELMSGRYEGCPATRVC